MPSALARSYILSAEQSVRSSEQGVGVVKIVVFLSCRLKHLRVIVATKLTFFFEKSNRSSLTIRRGVA